MGHEITISPKFLPGEKCEVLNYRKRPAVWERGEVLKTNASLYPESFYISYDVWLDRTTTDRYGFSHRLRLSVGDKEIRAAVEGGE
jgi:hypothetical protein